MAVSVKQKFASNPSVLRQGIIDFLKEKVPDVLDQLAWNDQLNRASGSILGASFTLEIVGEGPTILVVTGSISDIAAIMYFEEKAKSQILVGLEELNKSIS